MKPKTVGRAGRDKLSLAGHLVQHSSRKPGLMEHAIVLTLNGALSVQELVPGDKLITRDCGAVPIRSVDRQVVYRRAVQIAAGALSPALPQRCVTLAADQAVLLRDWRSRAMYRKPQAIAAAGALVDGQDIIDLGLQHLVLFRIFCDAPHIFYAQGLELGTPDVVAQMPRTRIAA